MASEEGKTREKAILTACARFEASGQRGQIGVQRMMG